MKRILLPTDFSDTAYNAMCYAVQLFEKEKCEFTLLHTYTPVTYNVGTVADSYSTFELLEVLKSTVGQNLDKTEELLKGKFKNPNHTFQKKGTYNLLINEMQDLIKEKNIELIVMGTTGATGAKEIFLGTNTMYTIKNVKCAVIAVPANFSYEEPKEILFPTDFKFSYKNKYLSFIRDLCKTHTSKLHIFNVVKEETTASKNDMMMDFLDKYFEDNFHRFHIAKNKDLQEAIVAFELKNKINLLIMIHNKHSFFENLLFKPVINKIVFHTQVPFLVIPSEERMMN
ncbi:nucleotide-binding universal stress UspA family protein [Gillisia sp. Hel_I_86]|uniref:universal stress protein n=1 Tax=Gillisia sp. Hel_I_86 TaxID=1249981 RepID=UPI001198F6E5|nr:universal stress protein [Gillisia sp. Hel_I_86]TVZ27565.1 nucleotide-binding universal stress UspA family protein [Gillisia sp. Hel_I_86]